MDDISVTETGPVTLGDSGHALNNALILRNIFEHLAECGSLQDLKNARLASSAGNWQTELQKVWRKEAVLVLRDKPFLEEPSRKSGTSLYDFHWELQNPDDPYHLRKVPYERVKLVHLKICLSLLDVEGPAKDFWNTVGLSIKNLKFETVKIVGIEKEIVWFLSTKTPNLESLVFEDITFNIKPRRTSKKNALNHSEVLVLSKLSSLEATGNTDVEGTGITLADLPNLQKIKLHDLSQLNPLLGHTSESGETAVVNSKVKHLDLWPHEDEDDWTEELDAAPAVHFTSLITLRTKLIPNELMRTHFITAHAATLVKLEAFRYIGTAPPLTPISREFPVLTELRLWGNVEHDLSFLRFTPNLQLLHMDLYGFEKKADMKSEIRHTDHPLSLATSEQLIGRVKDGGLMSGVELRKLEYCQLNCELTRDDIGVLKEWMPNLKTLKAVLDSGALLDVCAQWKELEHLECLFGSMITDMDIAPPKNVYAKSKLTDLKMLKIFRFHPECNGSLLTDESVEGFLSMEKLTELQIPVSVKEYPWDSEKLLRERIHSVKIHRQSCYGRDCCENMKYKKFVFEFKPGDMTSSVSDDWSGVNMNEHWSDDDDGLELRSTDDSDDSNGYSSITTDEEV